MYMHATGGMPRGLYKNKPQRLMAGLWLAYTRLFASLRLYTAPTVVWLLAGFWNRSDLIRSDKISLLSTPASGSSYRHGVT
jgi:hypothetical protein